MQEEGSSRPVAWLAKQSQPSVDGQYPPTEAERDKSREALFCIAGCGNI